MHLDNLQGQVFPGTVGEQESLKQEYQNKDYKKDCIPLNCSARFPAGNPREHLGAKKGNDPQLCSSRRLLNKIHRCWLCRRLTKGLHHVHHYKGQFYDASQPQSVYLFALFTGALCKEQDLSKFAAKLLYFLNIHS